MKWIFAILALMLPNGQPTEPTDRHDPNWIDFMIGRHRKEGEKQQSTPNADAHSAPINFNSGTTNTSHTIENNVSQHNNTRNLSRGSFQPAVTGALSSRKRKAAEKAQTTCDPGKMSTLSPQTGFSLNLCANTFYWK